MSDPHEWHIASDREGFFIEDEYGEEVLPYWMLEMLHAGWRCQSYETAQKVLHESVRMALDNYEPPEHGDAWAGGFADNH